MSSYYTHLIENKLGLFQDASIALSLRDLGLGATHVVRVRRDSDDLQQDFTAAQVTQPASTSGSLLNFCGAGNGFITTCYDQSGNNNHAFNNTSTQQHQIVLNGSLILVNGKPAIDSLNRPPYFLSSVIDLQTIYSVVKIDTQNTINYILMNENIVQGLFLQGFFSSVNGIGGYDGTNVRSLNGSDFNQNLAYWNIRGGNLYVSKNAGIETDIGTFNKVSLSIDEVFGRRISSSLFLNGKYQELVGFTGDKSNEKNIIETNINNHYTIY